jgi:hypothetical protein
VKLHLLVQLQKSAKMVEFQQVKMDNALAYVKMVIKETNVKA